MELTVNDIIALNPCDEYLANDAQKIRQHFGDRTDVQGWILTVKAPVDETGLDYDLLKPNSTKLCWNRLRSKGKG